ncbi:MAG: HAMP domain-containing histidine kinase [Clostridiales bacterium]|nr:HAMP domain-containing histidine kinase [Clostridiales bacterium]
MMKQNCYRLVRIVTNIIDLSKHDNGFLKLKIKNANIVSIVEDITMSIVKFAHMKNLNITFDTDIEEKIMAIDPDAIERIMLNLISNAIKFTKEGGSIYINIYDKGDRIIVSVKDTGVGIPESSLKSIFERFYQIDNTLSKNMEGSGIGLSLVKALVESHGGTISVESELNKGTEFIIELPVSLVENEIDNKSYINNENFIKIGSRTERINIEFSDIYGIK